MAIQVSLLQLINNLINNVALQKIQMGHQSETWFGKCLSTQTHRGNPVVAGFPIWWSLSSEGQGKAIFQWEPRYSQTEDVQFILLFIKASDPTFSLAEYVN